MVASMDNDVMLYEADASAPNSYDSVREGTPVVRIGVFDSLDAAQAACGEVAPIHAWRVPVESRAETDPANGHVRCWWATAESGTAFCITEIVLNRRRTISDEYLRGELSPEEVYA